LGQDTLTVIKRGRGRPPSPRVCRSCGVSLVLGENWAEHRAKKSMRFCKSCNWRQNVNSLKSSQAIQRERFNRKKANARSAGVEFTLRFEDIVWPTHCPVLGTELNYANRKSDDLKGRGSGAHWTNSAYCPSFDRIDPTKGYIPGNVVIVSSRVNTIKNNANIDELERVAAFYRQLISQEGPSHATETN
jgi:hypothetical protein